MSVISRKITKIEAIACMAICYNYHKIYNIDHPNEIKKIKKTVDNSFIGIPDSKEKLTFVGEDQMDYDADFMKCIFVGIPSTGMIVGLYRSENECAPINIPKAISYIQEIVNVDVELVEDPVDWFQVKYSMSLEDNGFECRQLEKRLNA
jgi:hypothetical protein